MPHPTSIDRDGSLVGYWRDRLVTHLSDYYAGIRLSKFPEDLRVYEHLLFAQKPEVVVEIGCQFGASSLWFADRLDTIARYGGPAGGAVIAIDIDVRPAREALASVDPDYARRITLVEGDVTDPGLARRVAELVGGRTNVFVIEDSAHTYETTSAALAGFAGLVPTGGFLIVEDGVVDDEELRLSDDWPRGVRRAIDEFLASPSGAEFECLPELEMYGLTAHPGGFLRRQDRGGPAGDR